MTVVTTKEELLNEIRYALKALESGDNFDAVNGRVISLIDQALSNNTRETIEKVKQEISEMVFADETGKNITLWLKNN